MAARILLEAMTNGGAAGLAAVAHRVGLSKGRASLAAALEEAGYVPERGADDEIKFRNCPFHALVEEDRETTCGMNPSSSGGSSEGRASPARLGSNRSQGIAA